MVYLVAAALLLVVVFASVFMERWSVPVILIALGAGILFGSDVLNWWYFDDKVLTKTLADLALAFVLYQGGFNTKRSVLGPIALPAVGLATWGVILTAALTFAGLYWGLGWSWSTSLLLGVIISSTDAAAVFSILRNQSLPPKVSSLVEVESAANDPMAVVLTVFAVEALSLGQISGPEVLWRFVWLLSLGPAIGLLIGWGAWWAFNHLRTDDRGYFYLFFLGVILLVYGLSDWLGTSALLAVFTLGLYLGNRPFVHKQGVQNFSTAVATLANVALFVLLGLLVFPRQFKDIWLEGLILFGVLTFVSRPLAVWLSTLGMKLGWRLKLFASWAGIRGAVPIVLATYPAVAGLEGHQEIFNLVFFVVLLSVLFQGSTLGWGAKLLGLALPAKTRPPFALELLTLAPTDLDLLVVTLEAECLVRRIQDLRLPEGAVITLVTRGQEALAPRGSTELMPGDQVTVLARASMHPAIEALFAPGVRLV